MAAPNAYEITVKGFDPVIEVARTPGRARANSWRSYTHCHDVTFGQFLKLSSIRKVQPAGFKRILVQGKPAWQTGPMQGNSIPFFYDDGDCELWAHYLDVEDDNND